MVCGVCTQRPSHDNPINNTCNTIPHHHPTPPPPLHPQLNFQKLRALHEVASRHDDADMTNFIEEKLLQDQAETVKKVAEYVSQLRRIGKVCCFDGVCISGVYLCVFLCLRAFCALLM